MAKIFITGDIHGEIDIHKLNSKSFPEGNNLTKEDYVIICGDFGLVWGNSQEKISQYWQKWLDNKPWTTLFVDGNHEDFTLLNSYPVSEWHGGQVHQISTSIIHLMRGELYDIGGYSFFTFGGGFSHDVYWRTEGISWWQSELPTHDEVNHTLTNLEKANYKADIIITHDVPTDITQFLGYFGEYKNNNMYIYDSEYEDINKFLQYIKDNTDYKAWFMGHYHIDKDILDCHLLYDNIIELTPDFISSCYR